MEQLKRYKEGLEGNILLKKREAYKGEANIQAVEKDKAKQDVIRNVVLRMIIIILVVVDTNRRVE